MSDSLIRLMQALGDDELVLGHRHSEWTGFAPHIEEDVAFSSIAQDEIGHAAALYRLIGGLTGEDPDRIALGRPKDAYTHAVLCERPNRDWAYTLARHWVYDTADDVRLEALEGSAHSPLAQLATKMRREERWHLLHADTWMRRVARGPVEGRTRLERALAEVLAEAGGLFEPLQDEDDAVKQGWLPVPSAELRDRFSVRVAAYLDDLGLPAEVRAGLDEGAEFVASSSGDLIARGGEPPAPPGTGPRGLGGRHGYHSDDFDALWDDLTHTYRNHPGASW